jgi:hypothetical protein
MTRWPLDPVLPHQFKLGCVCGSSGKMPLCARCTLRVGGIPVGIAAAKLVRDTLIAVDTPSAPVAAEFLAGDESMALVGGLHHLGVHPASSI